jgi:hypothetical protein
MSSRKTGKASPSAAQPPQSSPVPAAPAAGSAKRGNSFGQEGTNKTSSVPHPGAEPSDELLSTKTKFIEKSPYTRG